VLELRGWASGLINAIDGRVGGWEDSAWASRRNVAMI
jgi:hypothetical protein